MEYWGQHLILDIKGCNLAKANDSEYIRTFTKNLVIRIDMVPYGEPQIVHFADGTELAGWTVTQLIQTSNIMGHFLDISGDLYLDIFSCKEFDEDDVVLMVREYFNPVSIKQNLLFRQA